MGATAMIAPFVVGGKGLMDAFLPKMPNPLSLQNPPGGAGASASANDADSAAARARRKVAAGEGPSDQKLTGARGLGEIGGENLQIKTLLGY